MTTPAALPLHDQFGVERVIVKALNRCYYYGIDNEACSALAAVEPPLTGTAWDAIIAATSRAS